MTFVSQAFSLRREEDVRKGELGSQSSYIKNESDQKSHCHIMVTRWKMTRPWTHYSWSRSCAWANKETVKGDNMIVNITSMLKLTFLVYLAFLRGLKKATLCCCCFFFYTGAVFTQYTQKKKLRRPIKHPFIPDKEDSVSTREVGSILFLFSFSE